MTEALLYGAFIFIAIVLLMVGIAFLGELIKDFLDDLNKR